MAPTILKIETIGSHWKTIDPFLIFTHHMDSYPAGNEDLGPDTTSVGGTTDNNADNTTRWSMYYGSKVPGFPAYPHRGFETITILRKGVCSRTRAYWQYRWLQFASQKDAPIHEERAGTIASKSWLPRLMP